MIKRIKDQVIKENKHFFANGIKGFYARNWRILLFVGMSLAVWLIMSIGLIPAQVYLSEGQVADEDYFYEGATATYESEIRTEQARNLAASSVEDQYLVDTDALTNMEYEISSYFTAAAQATTIDQLESILPGEYSVEILTALLAMSDSTIKSLEESYLQMANDVYKPGVLENEVEIAGLTIAQSIEDSSLNDISKDFLVSFNAGFNYTFNKVFDAVATADMIAEAQNEVESIQVTVKQGEKIVSKGSVVTAEQVEALQLLGLQSDTRNIVPFIGLLLIVVLGFGLLHFYLRLYKEHVFQQRSAVLLMGVVIVAIILICKLLSLISFNMDIEMTMQIGYLMPIAAASMVLAVLLDRELAVICTIILAVFVGIIMDGNIAFSLVALAGGLTGILTVTHLKQRSQFMGASIYIIVANLMVVCAWGLMWHQSYAVILMGMLFAVINAVLSVVLAMGILPYLEGVFGITTVIRLLELSNSNHPLLKRLMMEAPGTYNHSILVGNLAEAAADSIGADTLLVRVSSYYHDIGKLKRPHFFIENQRTGENPHDKLQPGLSAMIITSHVTDGVQMLKDEHFPEEIIDIVEQHHGNGLLGAFYQKALDTAVDPEDVKRNDYCYKGRRPQTKEAGLVMLADSVQAAVQAMNNEDKDQVEAKVRQIIDLRIQKGQLSECPLTFRDIDVIIQSFLMVLSGINHQRIIYTETSEKPTEDGSANDQTEN